MKKGDSRAKRSETGPASLVCGIVMPISPLDGCSEEHWQDIKGILFDVVETAGFSPNLVSDADDSGIIQKRIIQNLYENPIVVCDVSGKNPNVMFELGIRLAFDKPTIIVKDDKTAYSFDTAPIQHLEYPRDLRFNKIVQFRDELAAKIVATHKSATTDASYTTFLKHFGTFSIPKIDTKEVSKDTFIVDQLQQLQKSVSDLARMSVSKVPIAGRRSGVLCLGTCAKKLADHVEAAISKIEGIGKIVISKVPNKHWHLGFRDATSEARIKALEVATQLVPGARFLI